MLPQIFFIAPPTYSSHHCHSSFTHTDHLHTVLTALCYLYSKPSHYQIFSAETFLKSPSHVLNFSHLSLSGRRVLVVAPGWGGWSCFWLFGEWRGVGVKSLVFVGRYPSHFWDVVGTSPYTYTCGVLTSGPTLWRVLTKFMIGELFRKNKQFFFSLLKFAF